MAECKPPEHDPMRHTLKVFDESGDWRFTLCAHHAHELGLGHGDHTVVLMQAPGKVEAAPPQHH